MLAIDQIKELHLARPFKPFRLHLADGRKYDVRHPEFLAFSRSGKTLHFVTESDSIDHIDVLMIVSVEEKPVGRGGSKRRKAG